MKGLFGTFNYDRDYLQPPLEESGDDDFDDEDEEYDRYVDYQLTEV